MGGERELVEINGETDAKWWEMGERGWEVGESLPPSIIDLQSQSNKLETLSQYCLFFPLITVATHVTKQVMLCLRSPSLLDNLDVG